MKRVLIIIILFFYSPFSVFSQLPKEILSYYIKDTIKNGFTEQKVFSYYIDKGKPNLKTKVLNELRKYNKYGVILFRQGYYSDGKITFTEIWKYDSLGRIIEFQTPTENEKYILYQLFHYNSLGYIKEIISFDEEPLKTKTIFEYNHDSNQIIDRYYWDSIVYRKKIYEYGVTNKLKKITHFFNEDRYKNHEIYKYNQIGELISISEYYKKSLTSKILYKYNSKNQLIEQNEYDYKGKIIFTHKWKYDHFGNIIELKVYLRNKLDIFNTYEYSR